MDDCTEFVTGSIFFSNFSSHDPYLYFNRPVLAIFYFFFTQVAIDVAQHATASMGKFDKMRSKADTPRALKKQKVAGEAPKSLSDEKTSAMGIFNKVMGKSTEKKSFDVVKVRACMMFLPDN